MGTGAGGVEGGKGMGRNTVTLNPRQPGATGIPQYRLSWVGVCSSLVYKLLMRLYAPMLLK